MPGELHCPSMVPSRASAMIRRYCARFVDDPVLVLPAGQNASFVMSGLTPVPNKGTVYHQYQISGDWGSLVADAVLVSTNRTTLRPAAMSTRNLFIPGYSCQSGNACRFHRNVVFIHC